MELLNENTKQEAIKRLQSKFRGKKDFIKRIFDIDPTYNGKYASWIERELTKILTENPGKLIPEVQNSIENTLSNLGWFYLNKKYINDTILNEFQRMNMNYLESRAVKKDPQNIMSYGVHGLQLMKELVEDRKNIFQKQTKSKKEIKLIFNNENYKIVQPLTINALHYYQKNTEWNDRFERDSEIYFIIPKHNPNEKIKIIISNDDDDRYHKYSILKANGGLEDMDFLYTVFPDLSNFFDELFEVNKVYEKLKGYIDGTVGEWELKESDELISQMGGVKSGNRKLSHIIIEFESIESYLETLGVPKSDASVMSASFTDYFDHVYSYDSISYEDWEYGSIRGYFDNENEKKFKQIIKIVFPDDYYAGRAENNDDRDLNEKIETMFPDEIRDLEFDFSNAKLNAAQESVQEYVNSNFANFLYDFNIYELRKFLKYITNPATLVRLYDQFDPSKRKTLKELFQHIGSEKLEYRDIYEFIDENNDISDSDSESLNKDIGIILDGILEGLEEFSGEENFKQFNLDLNKILKKYPFNKWNSLPKDNSKKFKISKVESKMGKITIDIRNSKNKEKEYSISPNELSNILYNYELFDF